MKKLSYISLVALLTLGACNSGLYTGVEYDDLYYRQGDQSVADVRSQERRTYDNYGTEQYYDNIYANDTLVAQEYSDAVDYENEVSPSGYDYYDGYSYSGRLRSFYGNYFDPYWRDPFYFSYGYPYGYSFGYSFGWPRHYGYYDPFMYGGGYYGMYDYYSPYYNPYYMYGGYPFYSSYYGYGGYGGWYGSSWYPYSRIYDGNNSIAYGRRERASTMSSNWNTNTGLTGAARRDSYVSSDQQSSVRRSADDKGTTMQRREYQSVPSTRQATNRSTSAQDQSKGTTTTRSSSQNQTRPEYNNSNRTYTPSYNNPRMPARPSYNNSRPAENPAVNRSRESQNQGVTRTPATQSVQRRTESSNYTAPSGNTYRSIAPSSSTRSNSTYSSPARSYSTPARSSSSGSNYNSGSSRSSSYSSGSSSYSGSSSSYSGGSSSSGSSSSSSGGGSRSGSSGSSSGRR
jgi:hypothetical protein